MNFERGSKPDNQPWVLASFAMGALVTVSFAAIGGAMSGGDQGLTSVPMTTAGWSPAHVTLSGQVVIGNMTEGAADPARPAKLRVVKIATDGDVEPSEPIQTAGLQTIGYQTPQAPPPAPAAVGAKSALAALDDQSAMAVLGEDPPPATPALDGFVSDPNPVVTPLAPEAEETDDQDVQSVRVERGDTFASILEEAGVRADDIPEILAQLKKRYDPSTIRAGQALTLTFGRNPDRTSGQPPTVLLSLVVKPSLERDVVVERGSDGRYAASEMVKTLTERTDRAQGVIIGSLYQSAMRAGVPEGAVDELIRIYSYDVDFQRDIQAGDKFDVLFTRYYDDQGVPVKLGTVLHATLTLHGERKPLYRYAAGEDQAPDYYNAEGMNGKRLLMKTPIDGARLTSGFGMRRHPILGYNKLHKGTDFAAPVGTPIMASGNGVIEVAGVAGGYGNYVRISHNPTYKTAYAHMSRFARGVRAGIRVRQGQIIGYVGTTGRSTGPHLHYEVLAQNVQVDSQSVKLPIRTSLEGKAMAGFKAEKARIDELQRRTPLINAVAARDTGTAQP